MNDKENPTDLILQLPHDAMTMLEAAERYVPNFLSELRQANAAGDKKEEERLHDRICTYLTFRLLDMFFAYYEFEPLSNKWKWISMVSLRSAWVVDLEKGRIKSPSFDRSDIRLAPMASRPKVIGRERALTAEVSGAGETERVRASDDFSTITVGIRKFFFRGSKQRQVVGYLYKAWSSGEPEVSVAMMWTDLDLYDGTRLRDLFKDHPDWRDLIAYKQGICWLKT